MTDRLAIDPKELKLVLWYTSWCVFDSLGLRSCLWFSGVCPSRR